MADVQIILKGIDQASDVIDDVSGRLGGLAKLAGGVVVAGLGAASAAVGALGVGLGIAVHEAMDAQINQARLKQVLQATGGAAGVTAKMANDLAMQLRDLAGGSDDAVLAAENVLLRFQNIGQDVFPDVTKTALDLAATLGIDTTQAALMLGKALEAPGEGLLRLKAAGVVFTDEQKKMIDQMVKAGDAAGAQKYILDALNQSIGGAAQAQADTFAGKWEILKGHLLEAAEGIGNKLLPVLSDLFDKYIGPNLPKIEALAGMFGNFIGILTTGDWQGALDNLAAGIAQFSPEAATLIGNIGTAIEGIVTKIGEVKEGGLAALIPPDILATLDELKGKFQPIIDAVGNLIAAFQESAPQIQAAGIAIAASIGDAATRIQTALGAVSESAGPTLVNNIATSLNAIADLWRAHGDEVIAVITFISTTVIQTFGAGLAVLVGIVGGAITLLSGTITAGLLLIQGKWAEAYYFMTQTALSALDTILAGFGTTMTEIVTVVKNTASKMFDAGVALMQGLIAGIQSMVTQVIAQVVSAVNAAVEGAKTAAGIRSPSEVFAGLGQQMMAGLALGIQGGAQMPVSAMTQTVPQLVGAAAGPVMYQTNYVQSPLDIEDLARRTAQYMASRGP